MSIIFTESLNDRVRLLPFTYTRPVADIRIGILKISEKWTKYLHEEVTGYQTEGYLQKKYPSIEPDENTLWISSGVLPGEVLIKAIEALQSGECLIKDGQVLVARGRSADLNTYHKVPLDGDYNQIVYPWDIFLNNGREIRQDFTLLTKGRTSQKLDDPHTRTYGNEIFLEEGATVKAAILNAETGPIYIGKNTDIQEGAVIRGPFALGDHSIVGMGCKVRGDTTVGPYSKIGGEVSNSVLFGYSNKAHDGYLGNSVIGEWCNLGAGTSNSNLKNNYAQVKMWDYASNTFTPSGLQFCGLIMGDHSKSGINTMFNTGSSVGVSANIFGDGFPRQIIPSFSWGGSRGFMTYAFEKSIETIQSAMSRKSMALTNAEVKVLKHIFDETAQLRMWEKQNQ